MTADTTREALPVVAWSYIPSDIWVDVVFTADERRAQLARDMARDVQPLCRLSDAIAAIMAKEAQIECLETAYKLCSDDRDALAEDAYRYQEMSASFPVGFNGETFNTKKDLDAAIDAVIHGKFG